MLNTNYSSAAVCIDNNGSGQSFVVHEKILVISTDYINCIVGQTKSDFALCNYSSPHLGTVENRWYGLEGRFLAPIYESIMATIYANKYDKIIFLDSSDIYQYSEEHSFKCRTMKQNFFGLYNLLLVNKLSVEWIDIKKFMKISSPLVKQYLATVMEKNIDFLIFFQLQCLMQRFNFKQLDFCFYTFPGDAQAPFKINNLYAKVCRPWIKFFPKKVKVNFLPFVYKDESQKGEGYSVPGVNKDFQGYPNLLSIIKTGIEIIKQYPEAEQLAKELNMIEYYCLYYWGREDQVEAIETLQNIQCSRPIQESSYINNPCSKG